MDIENSNLNINRNRAYYYSRVWVYYLKRRRRSVSVCKLEKYSRPGYGFFYHPCPCDIAYKARLGLGTIIQIQRTLRPVSYYSYSVLPRSGGGTVPFLPIHTSQIIVTLANHYTFSLKRLALWYRGDAQWWKVRLSRVVCPGLRGGNPTR